jgi:hypothetical protein
LKCFWSHWKGLEVQMSKMASHEPFAHLQPKLWAKEGPIGKLTIWLPTTKSREPTSFRHPILECNMAWKAPEESYKFGLDLVSIGLCNRKIWVPKVSGLELGTVSGLQLGSPRKKSHLDVTSAESYKVYYMGEGCGFPRVRAVVSQMCQSAYGLSEHPRVFPNAN